MKLILIDESIIECQAAELNEGFFTTNDGLLIPAEHVTGTCRKSEVAEN